MAQHVVDYCADTQVAAQKIITTAGDSYSVRLRAAEEHRTHSLQSLASRVRELLLWRQQTKAPSRQPLTGGQQCFSGAITELVLYEPQRPCTIASHHAATYLELLFTLVDRVLHHALCDPTEPDNIEQDYLAAVTFGSGRCVPHGVACAERIVETLDGVDLDELAASLTAENRKIREMGSPTLDEYYQRALDSQIVDSPPENPASESPCYQPDGWLKSALVRQVREALPGWANSTFDNIRKDAGLRAPPANGVGQQHRYSKADLRQLIQAAQNSNRRNSDKIVQAWSELLGE